MTQYLLSVPVTEGAPAPDPEQMQHAYDQVAQLNAELQSAGA